MDFCLLNKGNCLKCQVKLTDINTPFSFYGSGYKCICKNCNTIPVCKGILPYFKQDIILNLQSNNIIPNLKIYICENIYDEITYIFTDKNDKGLNGNIIECFIDFMINIFILKNQKKQMSNTDYQIRKEKIKQQTHNKHIDNLYEFLIKIHNTYTIIETGKYIISDDNITGEIDIVCETCLIDIKVVKKIDFQKYFLQLIIYYCIYNNPNIIKLGIYDYYKGNIYWLETTNINILKIIYLIKSLNLQNGKM